MVSLTPKSPWLCNYNEGIVSIFWISFYKLQETPTCETIMCDQIRKFMEANFIESMTRFIINV